MKIILVEGITDANLVRYIYSQMSDKYHFDDFVAPRGRTKSKVVTFENRKHSKLQIINLKGQDNLEYALKTILKPRETVISKIGIMTDADQNFQQSKDEVKEAISASTIDTQKINCFLTPNNKDLGNLETLLLSSLDKTDIPQLQCFEEYKQCLTESITDIEKRAIDKHEVEAYIKFSEKPRNRNQAQFSFFDNVGDTGLWDLSKKEFLPLIGFVGSIFC
jgi:Protein of unknown function (DUF3226).